MLLIIWLPPKFSNKSVWLTYISHEFDGSIDCCDDDYECVSEHYINSYWNGFKMIDEVQQERDAVVGVCANVRYCWTWNSSLLKSMCLSGCVTFILIKGFGAYMEPLYIISFSPSIIIFIHNQILLELKGCHGRHKGETFHSIPYVRLKFYSSIQCISIVVIY